MRDGEAMTEFAIQQQMAAWFEEEGLVSDSPPVVAAQENAGDPHYLPTARRTRQIRKDELVLLDLWAKKKDDPLAVFADITWVGFTGRQIPAEMAAAFEAIRQARDAAVGAGAGIGQRPAGPAGMAGRPCGAGRARAARGSGNGFCIEPAITSGATCTATACTWTTTRVTTIGGCFPGTGFTIEPGLYFESFGVRTEINMYLRRARGARHRSSADRRLCVEVATCK